jgi:hypothetical protein
VFVLFERARNEHLAERIVALAKKWDVCGGCEAEYARGGSDAVVADP